MQTNESVDLLDWGLKWTVYYAVQNSEALSISGYFHTCWQTWVIQKNTMGSG